MLVEQINKDMTSAMKNHDQAKLSVLRMIKSALQLEKINKKHDLNDDEAIMVIKKQVKIRKDSKAEYEKYQRKDLVDNLAKEIAILQVYLPAEMSKEEIEAKINQVFAELKPTSMKDMGMVIKNVASLCGNAVDMSLVSKIVKERLTTL